MLRTAGGIVLAFFAALLILALLTKAGEWLSDWQQSNEVLTRSSSPSERLAGLLGRLEGWILISGAVLALLALVLYYLFG